MPSLLEKIRRREPAILLYGLTPPKRDTPPQRLAEIAERQRTRIRALAEEGLDGLVVYDLQDESSRTAAPRPFPFLPTLDPEVYAFEHLGSLALPKIVYRCVAGSSREQFVRWLEAANASPEPRISVLVGRPSRHVPPRLPLREAYALAARHAPRLVLGGIAIAERHARRVDEHERILEKIRGGCCFFVTQAVYDVTSTKSLLSDYSLALGERGEAPVPIVLTFSPCGDARTLAFMKWLGIAFPRWLENDLRTASDPLAASLGLCERIFGEAWEYAREKGIPLGVNVESVSIRKAEIEASLELARRLAAHVGARPR